MTHLHHICETALGEKSLCVENIVSPVFYNLVKKKKSLICSQSLICDVNSASQVYSGRQIPLFLAAVFNEVLSSPDFCLLPEAKRESSTESFGEVERD